MNKTRAVAAAIVGLTLTATGALAAAPHLQTPTTATAVSRQAPNQTAVGGSNDNHGGAVSTLARGTNGEPDTTDTTDTQGAHGAAVSAVAQNKTAVGGPNHNHGGAVSAVARGTNSANATHGKSQAGTHPSSH